jgi:hypothetical protein
VQFFALLVRIEDVILLGVAARRCDGRFACFTSDSVQRLMPTGAGLCWATSSLGLR